jgi:hypothetical protein
MAARADLPTGTCTACGTPLPARQVERLLRQWTDTIVAENTLLRSLVRALTAGAGLRRPDHDTTAIRADHAYAFDLTPDEAALFDAINEEGDDR